MTEYALTAYLIMLIVAGFLNLIALIRVWPRRHVQGGMMLAALLVAVLGFVTSTALSMVSPDAQSALFWHLTVRFPLALTLVGPLVLLFLLQYLDYRIWLVRWRQALLFVIPAISIVLVWTNPLHHLFMQSYEMVRIGSYFVRASWKAGIWFTVHALYGYGMLAAALVVILIQIRRQGSPYRQQVGLIFAAVFPAVFLSVIDSVQLLPGFQLQLSPLGLAVMGPLLTLALTRHGLLDLLPTSYKLVLDVMTDAVVMVDAQNRVVELNRAAKSMLGLGADQAIGQNLDKVFAPWGDQTDRLREVEESRVDITVASGGEQLTYDLVILPIRNQQGQLTGRVFVARDITEQQRAVAQIRKLSRAVEYSPSTVAITDTQGRIEYVNPKFTELTGYTPGEVIGQNPRLLKTGHTSPDEYKRLWDTVTSGEVWRGEFHNRKKDGGIYWELAAISPVRNETGEITHFVKVAEDITTRKQAENTLLALLESAPDAMVIVNQKGTIVLINSQTKSVFGYNRDELIGKPVEMLIPEALYSRHTAHRAGYTADPHVRGMGVGLELYALRKDGSQFPVEISLSPIETEEGVLVASTIRDITERKRTDISIAQLAAIVESSNDAIFSTRLDGTITTWNQGAEQMFGYSAVEMIGQSLRRMIPGDLFDNVPRILTDIQRGQRVSTFETQLTRKDGRRIDVALTVSAIRDRHAKIIEVSTFARDVSDRKRELQEIEEALRKAEEASRLKSQFLAMMSHELRTPLNAVIGFSDVLLKRTHGELNDTQQDFLSDILSNGDHLLALISQLLDLSEIEAGKLEINNTPIRLRVLLDEVSKRLLRLAEQKNLELITYLDPLLPESLIGDSLRLEQILTNLIANAIKFTEKGRIEVRVDRLGESRWVISVTDTGIGIPAEALDTIFDEFQQADNSIRRRFGGTGLGLAVTRKLVLLMGGVVEVDSGLSKGSTFRVELPLLVSEQE